MLGFFAWNKFILRIIFVSWMLLLLIGCSSQESVDHKPLEESNQSNNDLYLRGDMTNWDALSQYKARAISRNTFAVEVSLVPRQYHFKFASVDWKPNSNFGALTEQKELSLDSSVEVKAGTCMDELTFTPNEAGRYRIILELTNSVKRVSIHKIHDS